MVYIETTINGWIEIVLVSLNKRFTVYYNDYTNYTNYAFSNLYYMYTHADQTYMYMYIYKLTLDVLVQYHRRSSNGYIIMGQIRQSCIKSGGPGSNQSVLSQIIH